MKAIVTAADQHSFEDATLYDVTYICHPRMIDSNMRLSYVVKLVRDGAVNRTIICRNRDGEIVDLRTFDI